MHVWINKKILVLILLFLNIAQAIVIILIMEKKLKNIQNIVLNAKEIYMTKI